MPGPLFSVRPSRTREQTKKLCPRSQSRTPTCRASSPPWAPPATASPHVKMDRALQGPCVEDPALQSRTIWLTKIPFRFSGP